ncbi:FabG Dehydrogenases with different specificities (related to short-chain alcohol dehydrogenases) [Sphingomonadaceae bacterium]
MTDRVRGKVALITGSGSGIGASICEIMHKEGALTIATDIDASSAIRVARALDPQMDALELDVSSEPHWRAISEFVHTKYGKLDILVNNAGVLAPGDAEDTDLKLYRWANSIMSEGVFLGVKHMMPLLRKADSGSIVNISSTAALSGYAGFISYCAAKGAVRSMTKAIAVSAQDRGDKIRCNSVHPGDIETPMQQVHDGRDANLVPSGVLPKGQVGAPEDVAAMALFLASDEARFITAGEFVVDNGATARPAW